MGKGALPAYSWWGDRPLTYIEAREKIYVPVYVAAVLKSEAWKRLGLLYKASETLTLWDFDGYDFKGMGMTFKEALHNEKRKMGHAIVLAGLLEMVFGT
jgi:hypothetical protein